MGQDISHEVTGGHSFAKAEGKADDRVDMRAADPADRGKSDTAAGTPEKKTGERPSYAGIREQGPNGGTVAVVEDDDRKTDCNEQKGPDTFGQIDID